MFDTREAPGAVAVTVPPAAEVERWIEQLGGTPSASGDAERIDQLRQLEALKSAAAAAQARITVEIDASQRAEQAAHGVPSEKQGQGIASQVALARRDSPVRGGRHVGLAKALVRDMPHTLAALSCGDISEWQATIMVRETATLSPEHRSEVDAILAGRLAALGDRGVERESRQLGYRLDPGSVLRRTRGARADRRVSLRPAPDTMSYLTGFLPVEQGVACLASLTKHAEALRAAGDERGRGQIMADTLVERLTGQSSAGAVPVEIHLVMTDSSLLGSGDTPGRISGHGPVPAALARTLAAGGEGPVAHRAATWVRRLYTRPSGGQLVAMDSRRRSFPGLLRRFLVLRDDVCRTSWCDAPIRHADHVRPVAAGGRTSADNGQGLCARCNQAKEAPGWAAVTSRAGPTHQVLITTPTGHSYTSIAPAPPGAGPEAASTSPLERRFADLIAAAA